MSSKLKFNFEEIEINLNSKDVQIIETQTTERHFTWRKKGFTFEEKKRFTRSIKQLNYLNLVLSLDTNVNTTGMVS